VLLQWRMVYERSGQDGWFWEVELGIRNGKVLILYKAQF